MNKIIFVFILFLIVAACDNNKTKTSTVTEDSTRMADKDHTDADLDTIPNMSTLLSEAELADDSVFDDGSIPTSWENAGINDPAAAKLFIKKLQGWVSNDQRDSIAANIDYPLRNDKKIKDSKSFLENYDNVITHSVKSALKTQKLNQVFRNAQGAMIGDGTIWIADVSQDGSGDFKIISINN